VPGFPVWLAVALLSAAVAFPAAAQQTPRSPVKIAPSAEIAPSAKITSTDKKFSDATRRLFKAVELNDMPNVKSSIDAKADLFAENDEGMTAADLAVDKGHFIVAHYLLSRRILGQTPPVILAPRTAAISDARPATKRKRRFASPPLKPAAPQVAEIPPMRITVAPAEKSVAGKKPAAPEQTPGEIVETAKVDEVEEVVEPPEPAGQEDKPLAGQGVLGFFKSLVDLITPGGEKPPEPAKTLEAPAEPGPVEAVEAVAEAAPDDAPIETLPPAGEEEDPFKETIVESIVDSSDEVIVEITDESGTGPDGPMEVVEEIAEDAPLPLIEDEQATVTADPLAEYAPVEEEEKGFLDRMASLFTSDDKAGDGTETAGDARGEASTPKGVQVTEYELPLPPPKIQPERKFSPSFLDKLADFLESGDEDAFNAWLPEMQVMNAEALRQKAPPSPQVAALAPPEDSVQPPPSADAPEPEPSEDRNEEPSMVRGVFNRLMDVLTPDFGSRERPERLSLDPEEKLAAVAPSIKKAEDADEAPAYWPITGVEAAERPMPALRKPSRRTRIKTSLNGVTLTLGRSVTLENSYPPGQGVDPNNQCVKKNRGTTLFCLETVDWPETMKADFLVPTILYTGQKAIARYDQGIASRFHALFPSTSFKRIAQYFQERFGKPTDAWNRSIAPFAQPRQDNPTLAWRSIDPAGGVITILEIRKYDDTRGGFPDTRRGTVMLYLANSPPIFPQVSPHELMRLSRGRLGPPSAAKPQAVPADIPDGDPEGAEAIEEEPAKKSMNEMTSEEIQTLRRKKKSGEATTKEKAPTAEPAPETPLDDGPFALPSDPLGR
jgi:hypothetical protein